MQEDFFKKTITVQKTFFYRHCILFLLSVRVNGLNINYLQDKTPNQNYNTRIS